MAVNKELVQEFVNGAVSILSEISILLKNFSADANDNSFDIIHKHTSNLTKSAEFIGLTSIAKCLKQIDKINSSVKNKKLKLSHQLINSIQNLLEKLSETISATRKNSGNIDENSINSLIQTAQNIENGIFYEKTDIPEIDYEILPDFIADTAEHIASAEENFLLLSKKGFNQNVVNTAYRNIHSIKGNCGFIHLYQLQNLCHVMETIMGEIREKIITVDNENVSFLLSYLDVVRETVSKLECGEKGIVKDLDMLIEKAKNKFPTAFGVEPVEPQNSIVEKQTQKIEPLVSEKINVTAKIEKETVKIVSTEKPTTKPVKETAEKKENTPVFSIKNAAQMKDEINKLIITEEMKQNFISDSNEQLSSAEEAFLLLEKNGFEQEIINNAYRYIHSFKGNCGFMQLEDPKIIGHTMETVMQFMREQKIAADGKSISFLLNFLDVLRNVISAFEQTGNASIPDVYEYTKKAIQVFPECFVSESKTHENTENKVKKEIQDVKETAIVIDSVISKSSANDMIPVKQDLRVNLNKLETIMNLVGELVISESMVTRNPSVAAITDESYHRGVHQLRRICNDLQDAAMSLRMIPLSGLFKKMSRLVHDLSKVVNKKIDLVIIGENTDVDKSVFELINDPLVHIIRNACDHGIEMSKERIAAGKKETGTITITAEHRGGAVWISVKDDGQGLNKKKILDKAVELGLISIDDQLTDNDVWQLILYPGFSTASIISDVSGRGVGMDVVQKNVEDLHGQIFITTQEGQGTEFTIRIPLTLAIIDGMIVKVSDSLYVVPTLTIKQSLRYDKRNITYSPEHEEILKYKDNLIPVIKVGNLFNNNNKGTPEDGILIIIEEAGTSIALLVDCIVGQQQIVIKGLSSYVNKARGTNGCTILGDGSIALILETKTLADMALENVNKEQRIPPAKNTTKKNNDEE
ncbi:MAG: chemotaxis protein CheA [Chitinispirillales bacterium]|jgi:two-component system chemotaxis sensor kinase CheA|nr:chemotaxis protein CheA [Chitinispirillales bacterium]